MEWPWSHNASGGLLLPSGVTFERRRFVEYKGLIPRTKQAATMGWFILHTKIQFETTYRWFPYPFGYSMTLYRQMRYFLVRHVKRPCQYPSLFRLVRHNKTLFSNTFHIPKHSFLAGIWVTNFCIPRSEQINVRMIFCMTNFVKWKLNVGLCPSENMVSFQWNLVLTVCTKYFRAKINFFW